MHENHTLRVTERFCIILCFFPVTASDLQTSASSLACPDFYFLNVSFHTRLNEKLIPAIHCSFTVCFFLFVQSAVSSVYTEVFSFSYWIFLTQYPCRIGNNRLVTSEIKKYKCVFSELVLAMHWQITWGVSHRYSEQIKTVFQGKLDELTDIIIIVNVNLGVSINLSVLLKYKNTRQ